MPGVAADTMLGIFGPLGLLSILGLLSAGVISRQLALDIPDWLPRGEVLENWRIAAHRRRGDRLLP